MIKYLLNLEKLQKNYTREIRLESLYSSSQDNQQNIFETLNDDSSLFWSSTGTQGTEDCDEILIYSVDEGYGNVNSFSLKFFFAHYLQTKLYPCKRVKFEAGLSSDNLSYSEEFACNLVYQDGLDDYTVTYQLKQNVLAKVIKITLSGRVGLQETDNQYYIAVERFKVFGVPISLLESYKEKTDLEDFVNRKLIDVQPIEEKNKQNQQLTNEIVKLTKNVANLIAKSQFTTVQNLFDKQTVQQQEAKRFIESQDVSLFIQYPELKSNFCAYDYLLKEPLLMQKYLQQCFQNTSQLSELESYVVVFQKINFRLIAKIILTMLQIYYQSENNQQNQSEDTFCKVIIQLLIVTLKYKPLPYDQQLLLIDYVSDSYSYLYLLVEKLTEYLDIPQEYLDNSKQNINQILKDGRISQPYSIHKEYFLKITQSKMIPFCYYTSLKIFLKKPITKITPKAQLSSQNMNIELKFSLLSQTITDQNINNSKRVTRLMNESSLNRNELLQQDQKRRQQAQPFIDSKDLKLIKDIPEFRNNNYVFEILMSSAELLNQYIDSISKDNYELNEFESISIFLQQLLDLLYEVRAQDDFQTLDANVRILNLKRVLSHYQIILSEYVNLNQPDNQNKLKQFTYTKSTSQYYYFVKCLQNYIQITDDDVENIVTEIKSKLSVGIKSEKKVISFSDYKKFIEENFLQESTIKIYEYIMQKYEKLPPIISHSC